MSEPTDRFDVYFTCQLWVQRACTITDEGGEPHDGVGPVEVRQQLGRVANVAINEVDLFEVYVLVHQAVVHPHGVSCLGQQVRNASSDIACTADNQHLRHPTFPPRSVNRRQGLPPWSRSTA